MASMTALSSAQAPCCPALIATVCRTRRPCRHIGSSLTSFPRVSSLSSLLSLRFRRTVTQCSAEALEGATEPTMERVAGPVIKVIGVGGGGSNLVNRMIEDDIKGVETWVVNTDQQALNSSNVDNKVLIGKSTKGRGAGGNPEIGLKAAKESEEELKKILMVGKSANEWEEDIREELQGADLVVVTAGLGGGTGSGAAPFVCKLAQEMGILTMAFATLPFTFEGRRRKSQADEARKRIAAVCDTMVVVPNDVLFESSSTTDNSLNGAFKRADSALVQGLRAINDIIMVPGLVNVDFADVCSILQAGGNSHMSCGVAQGEGRARAAARRAIESPLLEASVKSATGVVWNITGPSDLSLAEVNQAAALICDCVDRDANIIFGAVVNSKTPEVQVTVILTGFGVSHSDSDTGAAVHDESISTATFP